MTRETVPTYHLTERVATECLLTPSDVECLLAEHRAHIRVLPTSRNGWFRLTPLGHVGILVTPRCRLVIRPKIALRNLFFLLDPTAPIPEIEDRVTPDTGSEALDFLAGRLARLLTERANAGLHRAYAERAEVGPYMHGRLDVMAQVGMANGRKDRLHSNYEDFTVDVPCNRIARATAERMLHSPLLGDGVRGSLRQCLGAFAGVSFMPLTPDSFEAAQPTRLTEAYRPLLELCRLLADSLGPTEAAGAVSVPAFLLNMERVFEEYITTGVMRSLAADVERAGAVQTSFAANEPVAGQPDIHMRPDLVVQRAGHPVLVLDVKWKQGTCGALVTPDLYQLLAYCTALGARRGVLIYPGRTERTWRYELKSSAIVVEVRQVCVTGSRQACERSLARLARAVRSRSGAVVE